MMRTTPGHVEVWKHSIEVRCQHRVYPALVQNVEEVVVPLAGWDIRPNQAKEKFAPIVTRLKKIVHDGRVVVCRRGGLLVPRVAMKPLQPVAAPYCRVVGMMSVRLADTTISPRSRRLDR